MNRSKYGSYLCQYNGASSSRFVEEMHIFDFQDFDFTPWELTRFNPPDRIVMEPKHPFIRAVKSFFKTEAPCTVVCKQDSWSILLGKEKVIIPMSVQKEATFQVYITPYFVDDPHLVSAHLQGMALPAFDNTFRYKDCILYLDEYSLPKPGGCYFDPIVPNSNPHYRICILTTLPYSKVIEIAAEWRARRGVGTHPFVSRDAIATPKMIDFQSIRELHFSDRHMTSVGNIQKQLSLTRPHLLIQDILSSYFRLHLRSLEGPDAETNPTETNPNDCLKNLGLIVEWPLRLTYEGAKFTELLNKQYVALAVNGSRPKRVIQVRHPYERFVEYDHVPATLWSQVAYLQTPLELPDDVEKVSIQSTVIGFVYKSTFFCFNIPLLEGIPSPNKSRNMQYILSEGDDLIDDDRIRILETFDLKTKYLLRHVQLVGCNVDAWCITKVNEDDKVYPKQGIGSPLLNEWLRVFLLFKGIKIKEIVDPELLKLASVLTRHKICFKTEITDKVGKDGALLITDNEIQLKVGKEAVKYLNDTRVHQTVQQIETESKGCTIM